MSGGLYSPWGEIEIARGRTGAARLASAGARHEARAPVGGSAVPAGDIAVCDQEPRVDAEGQGGAVHEVGRGEGSQPRLPSRRAENKPSASVVTAGASFSHPAPASAGQGPEGGFSTWCANGDATSAGQAPAGEFPARDSDNPAGVELSDEARLFLRLIAAHHRCDLGKAIEIAAAAYCRDAIGLQRMADLSLASRRAPGARAPCASGGAPEKSGGLRSEPSAVPADESGDLVDVPPFDRSGHNRFSHTCGAEEGRTDAAFGGVRPEPQPP